MIDPDATLLQALTSALDRTAGEVRCASSIAEGLKLIGAHAPDLVLLDVALANPPEFEVLQTIRELDPNLPVAFMAGVDNSDAAIQAIKLGAFDYLAKPAQSETVRLLAVRAQRIRRSLQAPYQAPAPVPATARQGLIGRSPAMQEVYKIIGRVAAQDLTVLIHGESGTGKELVARAIYQHSTRADKPFLAINCAAIPETLLESELFGHEAGSFTGAERRRIGKFEQCSGGTLFLDEVGELPVLVQSKLLRVLQEQQFERVGGNETIHTDVRILAATNRNLEAAVSEGKYRTDLFYRLNGFTIPLRPLRERPDDIPLLLDHFLSRCREEMHKEIRGISQDALDVLLRHSWPGNVRELQSVVMQSVLEMAGPVLIPDFLPPYIREETPPGARNREGDLQPVISRCLKGDCRNLYAEVLEEMERYVLTRVLHVTSGNQSRTARILGISRGNLREKLKSLGMSADAPARGAQVAE